MDIYKSLDISIGTVMKNPEMIKFVHLKYSKKKLCKHSIKKLPYLLRYVPDQYKTQQICDKAVLEKVEHRSLFLTTTKIKTCVIKQLVVTLMH